MVQRWSPELSAGNINLKSIPLWFVLRNVPMHLYNCACLSYISSAIGKPLYMDKGTTNQTHLDFARICIEVSIEDDLPEVIRVEAGEGYIVEIKVVLPWSPERCPVCKVFGHDCTKRMENNLGKEDSSKDNSNKECNSAECNLTTVIEEGNSSKPEAREEHVGPLPENEKQTTDVTENVESRTTDVEENEKSRPINHLPEGMSSSSTDIESSQESSGHSSEDDLLKVTEIAKLCKKAKAKCRENVETHSKSRKSIIRNKKGRKKGKGTDALSSNK